MSSLKIERVTLHKISQSTIEPSITFTRSGDATTTRVVLPAAVGRQLLLTANKVSTFLVGYPVDLLWVGDNVVCAIGPDKQDIAAMAADSTYQWTSKMAVNIAYLQQSLRTWAATDQYFDGQYVYRFTSDPTSIDGGFGYRTADTFNLHHAYRTVFVQKIRAGFAYKAGGDWVVTPPVTAVGAGGRIQLVGDVEDLSDTNLAVYNTFGSIDTARFVNLCFVNFVARKLTDTFDYTTTEPLGIPLLMVEHQTFNLGGITRVEQQLHAAPLKFTSALAWLIGLHSRVTTLAEMNTLKQCIKMLLTKGNTRTRIETKMVDSTDAPPASRQELIKSLRAHFSHAPTVALIG
jgi:hypothetical protein